jgi:hypothetical protein
MSWPIFGCSGANRLQAVWVLLFMYSPASREAIAAALIRSKGQILPPGRNRRVPGRQPHPIESDKILISICFYN